MDIEGDSIQEKVLRAGKNKKKNQWHIRLQKRILGDYQLRVRFEKAMGEIPVGKGSLVPVPGIRIVGTEQEQGWIAISKRPNLEIEPVVRALEPVDPKELPSVAHGSQVFLAYRYLKHPWTLNLKVTRHEYEAVLTTIIQRAHFETVVSAEGASTTELILMVQNNQRQYLELRLPGFGSEAEAKILSLTVAGKPVRPARRGDGTTMIRMIKSASAKEAFPIRMVYESKERAFSFRSSSHEFVSPAFLDIPVSRTTWTVYLPFGFKHYSFGGNLRPVRQGAHGWARTMAAMPREIRTPGFGESRAGLRPSKVRLGVKKPALKEQDQAGAGVLPIDVSLVAEGQSLSFSKLGGQGQLRIDSMSERLYYAIHFVLFVLAIVICVGIGKGRLLPGRPGIGITALVVAVLPVFASPLLPMECQPGLDMVFAGSLLTGLVCLILESFRRLRSFAAELLDVTKGRFGGGSGDGGTIRVVAGADPRASSVAEAETEPSVKGQEANGQEAPPSSSPEVTREEESNELTTPDGSGEAEPQEQARSKRSRSRSRQRGNKGKGGQS